VVVTPKAWSFYGGTVPSSTCASPLYPRIRVAFTDHPITVWADALMLRLYFELIGLRRAQALAPLLVPFAKTSNNPIPAVDVLLASWYWLVVIRKMLI